MSVPPPDRLSVPAAATDTVPFVVLNSTLIVSLPLELPVFSQVPEIGHRPRRPGGALDQKRVGAAGRGRIVERRSRIKLQHRPVVQVDHVVEDRCRRPVRRARRPAAPASSPVATLVAPPMHVLSPPINVRRALRDDLARPSTAARVRAGP